MVDAEGSVVSGEVALPASEKKKSKKRKSEAAEVSSPLLYRRNTTRMLIKSTFLVIQVEGAAAIIEGEKKKSKKAKKDIEVSFFFSGRQDFHPYDMVYSLFGFNSGHRQCTSSSRRRSIS